MSESDDRHAASTIAFVHLSDLHIGTSLMPTSDTFSGGVFSGYNPHDFRLFRLLWSALDDAHERVGLQLSDPMPLVISGDLTQSGLDNDFATARALVHERWEWKRERMIGLGWPRDRTFMVPGNHDHWHHRKRQHAFNSALVPAFFEATPWMHALQSQSGSLRLELYGVDSNSGLASAHKPSKLNVFARGELSKQEIDDLSTRLSEAQITVPPEQPVVRALVCHHAFSGGGRFSAKALGLPSRAALVDLAGSHGIAAVLTGHTHDFDVQDWPIPGTFAERRVLKELRCGTTLQGTTARPSLHGFWLHQITKAVGSDAAQWTAWKYQLGATTFDVDIVAPVTFAVPRARTQPSL